MDNPQLIENDRLIKHREKVISTLNETEVNILILDTQEKYKNYIENLHHNQLRFLYRALWRFGSHGTFAARYNINAGNFSKWLSDKKGSPVSANAVRQFLMEGPPIKSIYDKKIDSSKKLKLDEIKLIELTLYHLSDAIKHVSELPQFSCIFIIDGDHAASKVIEIAPIAILYNIHVVVCVAKDHIPKVLYSFSHHSWLTVCITETDSKDAADSLMHAITFMLYSTILKVNIIPIIVVSGDGIAIELVANLRYLNHPIYHPSLIVSLGAWMLLNPLLSISDEFNNLRKLLIELISNIISYTKVPTIYQLIEITNTQLIMELNRINIRSIIPTYDIVTAYILSSDSDNIQYNITYDDIMSLSEEGLRFEYLNRYNQDMLQFCLKYGLRTNDFSSWINKRFINHEDSANAVRKWLMDIS